MAACVLVEKSEGVGILTMNRPDQLNAMNHQLNTELHEGVMRLAADDEVGCIVITGSGTSRRWCIDCGHETEVVSQEMALAVVRAISTDPTHPSTYPLHLCTDGDWVCLRSLLEMVCGAQST